MGREFTRNMFVMLLSIMVGIILITYMGADLVNRGKIDTLTTHYEGEITSVKGKSENFTSYFLKSSVILDQAREDRAFGNYHFDLALLWYQSALAERNASLVDIYKERGLDNCTNARPYFYYSYLNFLEAGDFFNQTKTFSEPRHLEVLDLYVALTQSGSRLTMLRYEASQYLTYLTENLTFNVETNNVTYLQNVTAVLAIFDGLLDEYLEELLIFEGLLKEIDEYEFFDEIR